MFVGKNFGAASVGMSSCRFLMVLYNGLAWLQGWRGVGGEGAAPPPQVYSSVVGVVVVVAVFVLVDDVVVVAVVVSVVVAVVVVMVVNVWRLP